jgi:uncharacterized protein (TIGR02284 family)
MPYAPSQLSRSDDKSSSDLVTRPIEVVPRTRHDLSYLEKRSRVARALGRLRDITLDGARGYAEAAREVDDAALAVWLSGEADERARLAGELGREVARLEVDPSGGDTFLACAHRAWMWIRARVARRSSDAAMLAECARGEAATARACERAASTVHRYGGGGAGALVSIVQTSTAKCTAEIAARRERLGTSCLPTTRSS